MRTLIALVLALAAGCGTDPAAKPDAAVRTDARAAEPTCGELGCDMPTMCGPPIARLPSECVCNGHACRNPAAIDAGVRD